MHVLLVFPFIHLSLIGNLNGLVDGSWSHQMVTMLARFNRNELFI